MQNDLVGSHYRHHALFHHPFSLDNTIVADIQPAVVKTLGEVDKLSWLEVAFVLGSSATITTW